jgi:hypothetical protein
MRASGVSFRFLASLAVISTSARRRH